MRELARFQQLRETVRLMHPGAAMRASAKAYDKLYVLVRRFDGRGIPAPGRYREAMYRLQVAHELLHMRGQHII